MLSTMHPTVVLSIAVQEDAGALENFIGSNLGSLLPASDYLNRVIADKNSRENWNFPATFLLVGFHPFFKLLFKRLQVRK